MSLYTTQVNSSKRQKTNQRDSNAKMNLDANTALTGLPKVDYKPDASVNDPFCFHFYNASEKVHGRTMEDWLRISISFRHIIQSSIWHNRLDSTVGSNSLRQWDEGVVSLENYKRRIRSAFELYAKLGIKYWSVYDRDLAPEGDTLEETERNLDEIVELVYELQQRTNIKLLWFAADLRSSRYSNGAATTSEPHVLSYAGTQLKKAIEVAHRLGAECFLFNGPREGYTSTLNTDHLKQIRNYAHLLKMIAEYKERIGYRGQLLFEPNFDDHHETYYSTHNYDFNFSKSYYRYDYDSVSTACFLKHHGLEKIGYKISTRPGHQMTLAKMYGLLGSVDSTCVPLPPKTRDATLLMKSVIEHGGLQPGGINVGFIFQQEPLELKYLLAAYINCIDIFAKGLRIASKLIADGSFTKHLQQRYSSFHSGFGSRLINGEASLEECEEQTRKLNQNADSSQCSQYHSYHWESLFIRYCNNSY